MYDINSQQSKTERQGGVEEVGGGAGQRGSEGIDDCQNKVMIQHIFAKSYLFMH